MDNSTKEITVGKFGHGGMLNGTYLETVRTMGLSKNFFWDMYVTKDKDQSPEGYQIEVYWPSVEYPGIFVRHVVLYGCDSTENEDEAYSLLVLARAWSGRFEDPHEQLVALKTFIEKLCRLTNYFPWMDFELKTM